MNKININIMTQIINLSEVKNTKFYDHDHEIITKRTPTFNENLDILFKQNQTKMNYSIKEVSNIINLSYDFIRERVKNGTIASIKFGDRFMINIIEVARILTEGI